MLGAGTKERKVIEKVCVLKLGILSNVLRILDDTREVSLAWGNSSVLNLSQIDLTVKTRDLNSDFPIYSNFPHPNCFSHPLTTFLFSYKPALAN